MYSTNVEDDISTLRTADLASVNPSQRMTRKTLGDIDILRNVIRDLDSMKSENDHLSAENFLLRRQLYLAKENAGLKVASVISTILSWFDEESPENLLKLRHTLTTEVDRLAPTPIITSTPKTVGMPPTPATPALVQTPATLSETRASPVSTRTPTPAPRRSPPTPHPVSEENTYTRSTSSSPETIISMGSRSATPSGLSGMASPDQNTTTVMSPIQGPVQQSLASDSNYSKFQETATSSAGTTRSRKSTGYSVGFSDAHSYIDTPRPRVPSGVSPPQTVPQMSPGWQSVSSDADAMVAKNLFPTSPENVRSASRDPQQVVPTVQPREDVVSPATTTQEEEDTSADSIKMESFSMSESEPEDDLTLAELESPRPEDSSWEPKADIPGVFSHTFPPNVTKRQERRRSSVRIPHGYVWERKPAQETDTVTTQTFSPMSASTPKPSSSRQDNKTREESRQSPVAIMSPAPTQPVLEGAMTPSFEAHPPSVTPTPERRTEINENERNSTFDHSSRDNDVKRAPAMRPTRRLIGEIAFQLDRRILHYIFSSAKEAREKKRFYGYIIQNIPDKIERESVDPLTRAPDSNRKHVLQYRFRYIMQSLMPLGYDLNIHPEFSAQMVNKYGLLPMPSDRAAVEKIRYEQKDIIRELVIQVAADDDIRHVLVLLDCLAMMSKDDGKPLFVW